VETASTLPTLYGICGTAQACACASAGEAALGLAPSPLVVWLRRLLVDAETVKEHLWRILLDWPRFLGEPPLEAAMSKVMDLWLRLRTLLTVPPNPLLPGAVAGRTDVATATLLCDGLARLSATHVLGTDPGDWLTRIQTREDLLAWAASTDTASARLVHRVQALGWGDAGGNPVIALPRLTAMDLERLLSGADAARFVAEPRWEGEPRESSPFTRRLELAPVAALTAALGNGLLPRLAAQLMELASLQQALGTALESPEGATQPLAVVTRDRVGVALIPAARGLLVHRAMVDQGRILDYQILAPTAWNFHPRGVVALGLSALPDVQVETLERQARLFVTALDPCVDYHLTVS
jgi:hypothetical protein